MVEPTAVGGPPDASRSVARERSRSGSAQSARTDVAGSRTARAERGGQPLDRSLGPRPREEVGRIVPPRVEPSVDVFTKVQAQIEDGGVRGLAERRHHKAIEIEARVVRRRQQLHHGLHERGVGRRTLRVDALDDLGERDIGLVVGADAGLARPFEQLPEARVAGEI